MEIIAYASIAYLLVRLLVSLVNLLTRPVLKHGIPLRRPKVSVLIPVRNEERNIGLLLNDLKGLDYSNFEILVYDDQSTDGTASVVLDAAAGDSRIHYIKGEDLPAGWLGKNHGCYQLSYRASGEYLLFLDADVRCGKSLLDDAISAMETEKTALLSIFPVQEMKSIGEWLTVPLMNRILLGNLPLVLVRRSAMPSFSAANGQFMMFEARVYRQHNYHELFRSERVEDIRIIRYMKRQRYSVQTLVSDGTVRCRMYSGFLEAINGFSKNIHAFFGSNWLILFLFIIITTLGPFAVWFTFPVQIFIIFMLTLYLTMFVISIQSRQSSIINLLLFPFQQITTVITSILAAYRNISGKMFWKGRNIQ